MRENRNLVIVDCTPTKNVASASDNMTTVAQVFWCGVHLWDIARDERSWHVYATPSESVLAFALGGFGSRELATARVHEEAFALEAFMHRLWFRPRAAF